MKWSFYYIRSSEILRLVNKSGLTPLFTKRSLGVCNINDNKNSKFFSYTKNAILADVFVGVVCQSLKAKQYNIKMMDLIKVNAW